MADRAPAEAEVAAKTKTTSWIRMARQARKFVKLRASKARRSKEQPLLPPSVNTAPEPRWKEFGSAAPTEPAKGRAARRMAATTSLAPRTWATACESR